MNEVPKYKFRKHIDDAIDELDAAMFSGDLFINKEATEAFNWYLQRWERGLLSHAHAAGYVEAKEEENE